MKEQEAIQILTVDEELKKQIPNLIPAYDAALEALKKQIPQRMINIDEASRSGNCPICNMTADSSNRYCCYCGQRLEGVKDA